MWQSYAFGSLLAGAFENAADKAGIVHDAGVDSYVASFYRAFFFLCAAAIVGATGLLGDLSFFFHWSFLPLAVITSISTLLFTYLLRTVEVTVIGAAAYLAPFLFLILDTKLFGTQLSQIEMLGIVLLVCGGLAFSLDGKTHHFRRDIGWKVWGAILFIYVFSTAIEAYLFKYLHAAYEVNAVTYYVYSTIPGVLILLAVLVGKGRTRMLFDRGARAYIPYAALGKSFDSFNSILYMMALGMATLSQVSAFNALMPLMVVVVALFVQGLFGFRLKEHLDMKRTGWKFSAAVVLVVGGLLVG
jgi:drug/metabolite transporter (DMT)-like permease